MRSRALAILAGLAAILCLRSDAPGQTSWTCTGIVRGTTVSSQACASRATTARNPFQFFRWSLGAYRLSGLSTSPVAFHGGRVPDFGKTSSSLSLGGFTFPSGLYSSPFLLLTSSPRTSTPDNWLGGSGNWSTAADWTSGVPTSSSAVTIGNTSSGFVTENLKTASAASLSVLSGNSLRIAAGNTLTVGGTTSLASGSELLVGDSGAGGSVLNSGSLTNAGYFQIGNSGMTSASGVRVTGALNNTGGTISIQGGTASGAKALLNVSGAATGTLTGQYQLYGSTGSAAVEFGSGGINSIGDGGSNSGYLLLSGPNAYMEVGATNSNSALSSLTTIASNGELDLQSGASVTTTGALTNSNQLRIDGSGNGGSSLTVGGSLSNGGVLQLGNTGMISAATLKVNGTLNNTAGTIIVSGSDNASVSEVLNVTGAEPSTLTGNYYVEGGTKGSAAVEFGSGGITSIGDGSVNSGFVQLSGTNAYMEVGAGNSNNALTGLKTIASNGELDLQNGASLTTTGALTNSNQLRVDDGGSGGSSLTIGGSLTNSGFLQLGNTGMTSAATLKVNGTLNNSGGTVVVNGSDSASVSELLNVSGAAPSVLTGNYYIQGGTLGSAAVEFGSGGVTSIGDGASNSGFVLLSGTNAFMEVGTVNSNNALTALKTIANNGELDLQNGASLSTTGALTNSNQLRVDDGGNGGSRLILGGSLTNSGYLQLGNSGMSLVGTLNVNGTLNNTGGTVVVAGSNNTSVSEILNVSGAAPSTLTGSYFVEGGTLGTAAVQFGSGGLTTIGDGASNSGFVLLSGPNAYMEVGAVNSNDALTGLKTIASNGELDLQYGASVTTTSALTNSNQLRVDDGGNGGSSLTIGGSLTNSGYLQLGNSGMGSVGTLKVNGTLSNTDGTVVVNGSNYTSVSEVLNVAGAAPSTLTGNYYIQGGTLGSAAVEFGLGGITSIGDGASNSGFMLLSGSNAYMQIGASNSNSALTGLKTIASNGELDLQNGASLSTTGALTNGNQLRIDDGGSGGSTLTVGGAFTNSGYVQIGSGGTTLANTLKVSGTSIVNTGTISLFGGSTSAMLEIGSSKVTLSGAGTVNLSDATTNLITGTAATDTLVNANNTIQGAGSIANIGVVNAGTILANQAAPLVIAPSTFGLNNSGTLAVNAGSTLQITTANGGSLLNFSGTTLTGGSYLVGGTFQFGASGTSIVTNAANITLSAPGSQIIDLSGGDVLANLATNAAAGSFNLSGGQNFATRSNFTNNGTLGVDVGSTFVVNGNLTNFSGTTLIGGTYNLAGTLQFNGANIVTDAANISLTAPTGQIINQSGVNALTNLATIARTGSLSLSGGTNFTTAGNFTNNGSLSVANGSQFLVNGNLTNLLGTTLVGGTYNVGGTLRFNGANIVVDAANISLTSGSAEIMNQSGGNALANLATVVAGSFSLSGGANFSTAGKFNNAGTLSIGSGSSFVVNGNLANFVGTTLSGGVFSVGGTLQFNGANIVTNASKLTLTGPSAQIIDQNGSNALANLANNTSSGKFTVSGGKNLSTAGSTFSNAGLFTISSGSTFTVGNGGSSGNAITYVQNAGTTTIDGSLTGATTTSGAQLNLNGGNLFGTGTIGSTAQSFAVSDSSTLTPGDSLTSPGRLTVDGTYAQAASGSLDISIEGNKVGTQYDQLDASGVASLASGSTLNIKLLNGFVPTLGSSFDILNASSLSGTFTNVNGVGINSSEHFSVTYNGKDVILTVVSGPLLSHKSPLATPLRWPTGYGLLKTGHSLLQNSHGMSAVRSWTPTVANSSVPLIASGRIFNPSLSHLQSPPVSSLGQTNFTSPALSPKPLLKRPILSILTLTGQSSMAPSIKSNPGPQTISPFAPMERRFASGSRDQTIGGSMSQTRVPQLTARGFSKLVSQSSPAANRWTVDLNGMQRMQRVQPPRSRSLPASKNFAYHLEMLSIFGGQHNHFVRHLFNPNGNQFGYLTIQ